jgi:Putative Ig domain
VGTRESVEPKTAAIVTIRPQCCAAVVAFALLFVFVGCGGGGSTTTTTNPPPRPPQLTIPNQALPEGLVGTTYTGTLKATGGTPPYTWSTPLLGIAGLSLASNGTISGTPLSPGTYIPNFTVTDSSSRVQTASLEIDIVSPLVFQTASQLLDQNIGLPVWTYVQANGGKPPYTYALVSGSTMPPGLSFQNSGGVGLIQGTPTTPGTYSFTVQASDSFSPPMTVSQAFTMNILNNMALPNSTLPDAVINLPYQGQIQLVGGTPPYHFVLGQYSSTPPGIKMDSSTGIFSGTPTTLINDQMLVYITDSATPNPGSMNAFITLNVQPALSIQTTSLPDSARGLNYPGTITVAGGRAPFTAQVISGALPGGLTLGPSPYQSWFNVSGVPNTDGLFNFTVQVSDSYSPPNTSQQTFQVRISDQMNMTGPYSVYLLYNQAYTATWPITGGYPPYTWSMNPVPPGFSFDITTGTLSGTPISGADYSKTSVINAHDSSNPPLQANYQVLQMNVINKLKILTTALPPVAAGRALWVQLLATGGGGPYAWTVNSGSLPTGVTLNGSTGLLQGTPTAPGTYSFTVAVSDAYTGSQHQTANQALSLVVNNPAQMQRNETLATATPLSSVGLLGSISPYSDPGSSGPDIDVYQVSAAPGTQVNVYVSANNDFIQPPAPNSLLPVLEIVDANGVRYQTCTPAGYSGGGLTFNNPCINGLNGVFYQSTYYNFLVPGTGTTPVTFYVRVSDARGDARPDFIYSLTVYGVN